MSIDGRLASNTRSIYAITQNADGFAALLCFAFLLTL